MRRVVTAFLCLVPLLAACGVEEAEDTDWEANQLMEDTLPDPAAAPGGEAAGEEDALTVTLTEWNIRLAQDTIPAGAGTTRFRARNTGELPHILEVEGQGQEWVSDTIPPGGWVTLEARLEPGSYELYCPIQGEHGNHREQGMVAHLVVR